VTKKDFKTLIADNDRIAQDIFGSQLSREGFTVLSANNGLDAIRILQRERISLIITDLRLYGDDGIEMLKHIVWGNPEIAVVILTAYGNLESALNAVKEYAYDYLTKPFKVEEVTVIVEKAYKRSLLIHENRKLIEYLRDTYNDIEVIRSAAQSKNPEVTIGWLERMERLRTMNVLSSQEAETLKERFVSGA
jgi:DNA-binding NtrC family response regulator